MLGDTTDMARRVRALVPQGWFNDQTPVLDGLLQSVGTAWSLSYGLINFVVQQARISTASGIFLDLISSDFFGTDLPRFNNEQDKTFVLRIKQELLRPRGTRAAVILALQQLTGRAPAIFEPALTSDTGGYTLGGVGYCVSGGWGNLALPFQSFITAYRAEGSGIAQIAGYATGGVLAYGDLSMEPLQISDADIIAAIPPLLPAATTAWVRISN